MKKYFLHRANTLEEVKKAHKFNCGVEVDIRTYGYSFVASHDITNGNDDELIELLEYVKDNNMEVILDVKETGIIQEMVDALIYNIPIQNIYFADLIVPDMLMAEKLGYKTLARFSPYETISTKSYALWMDYVFTQEDFNILNLTEHKTFFVSPELHTKDLRIDLIQAVVTDEYVEAICTDFPLFWRKVDEKCTK